MKYIFALALLLYVIFLAGLQAESLAANQPIDLETAWQRLSAYAPSLEIAEAEISIKEADKRQASARLNPLAGIEIEDIWGSGPYRGWESAQITYNLWQTLELGGKRAARRQFAASQTGAAYWQAELARQNLRYELTLAFLDVYQSQEKLKIAKERQVIAEKTLSITEAQVKAGKVSPIQTRRAQITLKSAQIALRESASLLMQAKKKLSFMWGQPCPDFEAVFFPFFDYERPYSLCGFAPALFKTSDFAKSEQDVFTASQNLKLQKANRVPDLTLRAAYRTHHDTDDYSIVIEAQIPIPLFDQNQGNIAKARLQINQALSKREETVRNLREKLTLIHEQLAAAFDKADLIQNGVLAEAWEAVELTQEGYQKGKLQYLDLLDAQGTLFEIQEQLIEALTTYHAKKAELERWIGYQLDKD